MRIILATIAFVMLATPSLSNNESGELLDKISENIKVITKNGEERLQYVSAEELVIFGWDYINKEIYSYGIPTDLYACQAPVNRGLVCFWIDESLEIQYSGVFDYSVETYAISLQKNKCSKLIGKVLSRKGLDNIEYPTFVVSSIKYAEEELCKH